ncbi:MAG TPA: hypothetical protein VGW80_10535 [Solirubrobacterales bacterium]|jgi:hypothetical protein|nr:hypothetical protein [Solirubrobacterales bacterium]
MLSADEPEWEPLLNFAPDHVVDFMWMFAVQLTDGTRLQAYKHYWTRDYLHLDNEGRAFNYAGNDRYEEVNPPWLFTRVLGVELEERYSVRQNVWPDEPSIRFARSATRHRISRERSLYVVERCGMQFVERRRSENWGYGADKRVYFFGDDLEGVALEVVAAENLEEEFTVIHAMNLRTRYLGLYEEAKGWRR